MKARITATGEIVEVYFYGKEGYDYVCNDKEEIYERSELEILEDPDYWTRLEHTYAGMAMQGMMAHTNIDYDEIVDLCVEFAHALVEKYKEKEE